MKYDDKTLEIGCWLSVCSTYSSLTKFAEEEALKKQLEVSNPKEARLNLLIYFMFLTEWFVNQFIKPK